MKAAGRADEKPVLDMVSRALPPEEQASLHLRAVLPSPLLPFEAIEIRCLNTRVQPAAKGPRLFAADIEEAVQVAMQYCSNWDVFFGVGTRACPAALSMHDCPHQQKGSDHVSRLQAVWGDFDVKPEGYADQEEIVGCLQDLDLAPTCLVSSGAGIHAYWRLNEATREMSRVEQVNRSLRTRFGADNAVDAARILRVAGTFNYKHQEPSPVLLLEAANV